MQGVTTAIVAFIFVCMAMPRLVKNRAQFYAAFAAILLVILLDALAHVFPAAGMARFSYVAGGLLQVGAIILLMLSAGGLTAREFAGELAGAYEVVRRGEEEKEVIIPLEGQMAARSARAPTRSSPPPPADEHKVYTLDEAGNEIPAPPPDRKEPEQKSGIPLA